MDKNIKESIEGLEFAIDVLGDFCDCAPEEVTEVYGRNIDRLEILLKAIKGSN